MRVRSVVPIVVSVMLLAFAIGCAKQEPPEARGSRSPRGGPGSGPGGSRGGRQGPLRSEVRRLPRHRPGDRPLRVEGEVGEHREGDAGEEGRLDLRRRSGQDRRVPHPGARQRVTRRHGRRTQQEVPAESPGGGAPLPYQSPPGAAPGGRSRGRPMFTGGRARTEPPLRGDAPIRSFALLGDPHSRRNGGHSRRVSPGGALDTPESVFPVFLVVAAGVALRRYRFLDGGFIDAANSLVYYSCSRRFSFTRSDHRSPAGVQRPPRGRRVRRHAGDVPARLPRVPRPRARPLRNGGVRPGSFRANLAYVGLPIVLQRRGAAGLRKAGGIFLGMIVPPNGLSIVALMAPHGAGKEEGDRDHGVAHRTADRDEPHHPPPPAGIPAEPRGISPAPRG